MISPSFPTNRTRALTRALFLLFSVAMPIAAPYQTAEGQQMQEGRITYVTSTTAYADLGTNHGFDVGDTLRVGTKTPAAAVLVVTNISSRSMATQIVSRTAPLREGDPVRGIGRHATQQPKPTLVPDTARLSQRATADSVRQAPLPTPVPASAPVSGPAAGEEIATTVRGRISTQYYALTSSTTSGFDFNQPALVLSLTAERLLKAPLKFEMYSNHRYDARSASRRSTAEPDPLTHRVYLFSLQYGETADPFRATLGRFIAPMVGGIGTFDGGMLVTASNGWEAGLMGGSQPGYRNSEIAFDDPKFAAYVAYTSANPQSMRYQGSGAFAQTYRAGALDRSFFYLQNVASFGNDVSLYQNLNVDLYDLSGGRGVLRPHLSDIFLSATYRPLRWLSANGSYAMRRNVYFLRSFGVIADSLFDRAAQHNFQLGIGANLPLAMFVSISGTARVKDGGARAASSLMGRYTWANTLQSGANLTLMGSVADNIYNRSTSYGTEVNRDLLHDMYGSLRVQRYGYSFSGAGRRIDRTSASIDLSYRIGTAWYASLSVERYWENSASGTRYYSDVSYRF